MRKTYKITYTLAAIFAAMVFIFSSFVGGGAAYVHAATSTTAAFDKTNVLEDLQSSEDFNILKYPYDSTGLIRKPEIISVVEYCYSFRPGARGNYGVYIYFYNPQAINIVTDGIQNKITMATAWKEVTVDGKTSLQATDYEKFELQYCDKTTGDYRDLFYKFKVVDHISADGKTIAERVNSNARRYDISEVELVTYGERNATAYGVGASFVYTGYAAGYGADSEAESTLKCERAEIKETIELDISGKKDGIDKRTYWRSNSSSKGAHHQNQINSVFFAIDTNVLENYGYVLQKMKAEWWEYKTVPAIVIDNKSIFDRLSAYRGVKITEDYDRSRELSLNNKDYFYVGGYGASVSRYQYSWNAELGTSGASSYFSDYIDTLLPLLFDTNGIPVGDYVLSASALQNYCETYTKSFEKGKIDIGHGRTLSADLFMDSVDDGRIRGYNLREFDISNPDDFWQINSYDSSHNWLDKLKDYGFGSITTNDDYSDILPIQMLKAEDFAVSNIADHLKINSDDVNKLKNYFNASISDKNNDGKPDNAVFLFRYAQTDYWAEDLHVFDIINKKNYFDIGTVLQGTQIFDFDILTMTFNKNGELTTFGVVMSPVDHWTSYTPPINPTYPDLLSIIKKIFAALAIIALIVIVILLLIPILSPLFGAVGQGAATIVKTPFKSISNHNKKRKERRQNHKKKKE